MTMLRAEPIWGAQIEITERTIFQVRGQAPVLFALVAPTSDYDGMERRPGDAFVAMPGQFVQMRAIGTVGSDVYMGPWTQ